MPPTDNSNESDGDSIKVYLRVRPPDKDNHGIESGQILTVRPPDVVILPCKPEPKVFTFDNVADTNTTQESVFAAVGKKTIESCVAGYNATIFAYGQTGSGKTFTMLGPSDDNDNFHHELRGVIPRSFEYLFSLVNREREKQGERFEFMCRVSFLEIYNEQVFDLLDAASLGLNVRENFKRGVFVDGLIERVVTSPSDAYEVLASGWLNRRVASTSMNRESSRSHAVFTFTIETKEKKAGVSNIRMSQLNLVDLAGSERQKDTKTCGQRLKEAGNINKSLLTLGHVITALVDISHGKTRHVPYRDSKLSFLLRDSLGGNTKTYIIANVHPGAKCFGETLSTLNFARRAKMIKNKAVVNQDTQGNTLHLQAEIRRLQQQLMQFTQGGGIPTNLGNSVMNTPTSQSTPGMGAGNGTGEKKWKGHFLDAMYLRERTDNDKKKLLDNISRLEDLAAKKEQYLQSTKMIIRFRENTIARLQKSAGVDQTTTDDVTIDLKSEISSLREQLSHNPTITKYAMENYNLRNENKKLGALQSVREGAVYETERAQQLERVFKELMAKMEGRRSSSCPTPSMTPSQHPIGDQHAAVSSMLDKYKTQAKQMQAQRDASQQELIEQKEVSRKTQQRLEAEVATYKKAVNELENTLEAFKVKNKIERDTMNNLHMQTILTITTPSKAAYNLRNRLVPCANGTPVRPCMSLLDSSPLGSLGNEDGIADEEMPDHMVEQCNEALTTEVQELQGKLSKTLQRLQDTESHVLKYKQTVSLLEHKLKQDNQTLESEQRDKSNLQREVSELTAKLEDLRKDYLMARSEAEDMRIMFNSADKIMDEERRRLQDSAASAQRAYATLEAKVLQIEMELCTKARDLEKAVEGREQLQDVCGTLQAEVDFKEQGLEQLEAIINKERSDKATMQEEIQSLMEKLDGELERNSKLIADLREGSDTKRELLETLEVTAQLRNDNGKLQSAAADKDSQLAKYQDQLETATGTISLLHKRAAEDKDALSSMVTTVQDLRSAILVKEDDVNVAASDLEDTRYRCDSLLAAQAEYKNEIQGLQRELEERAEELNSQGCAHHMEMEMFQEELEEVRVQYKNLMLEMTDQENHLQSSQQEYERQSERVVVLSKQLSDKEDEMQKMQDTYESQLEEAKSNISTVVVEADSESNGLRETVDKQTTEIASLRTRELRFTELLEHFELMRETKNEEIQQLKSSLEGLEHVHVAKEILEVKCQTLEYRVEQEEEEAKERETELQFRIRELSNDVDKMNVAFDSATSIKDSAVETTLNLQLRLAQLECNNQLMEENGEQMIEELERIKALESSHFEEKENLKSRLEQLREEKMHLTKEMKELNERNAELTATNAKLAGHQNLKQKIHYHQQVKNENLQLKEQLGKTKTDTKVIRDELDGYKKIYGDLNHTGHAATPLEAHKENVDPRTLTS